MNSIEDWTQVLIFAWQALSKWGIFLAHEYYFFKKTKTNETSWLRGTVIDSEWKSKTYKFDECSALIRTDLQQASNCMKYFQSKKKS